MSTGFQGPALTGRRPPPIPDVERRVFPRRTCQDGSVRVVVLLGSEPCPATVRDMCPGGIGLFVEAIVAPGDLLNVECRNPATGAWFCKTLQVIHAAPAQGGRWLIGGAFDQPLALDDLRRLLQSAHGS